MLLVRNLDSSAGLVNGATGVVTAFVEEDGEMLPEVEFEPAEGLDDRTGVTVVVHHESFSINLGTR